MSRSVEERDAWQFGRRHPTAPVAYIDNGLGEELAVVYQCETPEKLRAVRLMAMAPYLLVSLKAATDAIAIFAAHGTAPAIDQPELVGALDLIAKAEAV